MSVEDIKGNSRQLRGTIADELAADTTAFADEANTTLLKFHGIYQQDDRDVRRQRAQAKLPLDYSCMVRASVPGGRLTADQWLALDRLADVADGTLRLTTRQGVQFHTVHKGDLHDLVAGINNADLTTLAACGDVVRNIMGCPWPDHRQAILGPLVDTLVRRFRPRTTAYWEVWVDGTRAVTAEPVLPTGVRTAGDGDPAGILGTVYLPRKFKIGVAWPGDSCIDVLANDVGLVPTFDGAPDPGKVPTGYAIFVGGGMGMSHARPDDTYPRIASPLGWTEARNLVEVVEAIVTTQRDYGNREDRQRARLKYLVDERGTAWVRDEVERRSGLELKPPIPFADLGPWDAEEHHHDGETDDGTVVALPVASGKVADRDGWLLRSALRQLTADRLVGKLRVTARQDLLLAGIAAERADEVRAVLRDHGVALSDDVTPIRRLAIACPALPTCGQALGEAERVLPDLTTELEAALDAAGASELPVRLNMTGCPNGCSRPYAAEIGIVGRTKKTYDLYVGGSATGDRLGRLLRADVPFDQVAATLAPLFAAYRESGSTDRWGDWAAAADPSALETLLPDPVVRRRRAVRT